MRESLADKNKGNGIESAFIANWKDWEGDQSQLYFFDCTLTSDISEDLGMETVDCVELNLEEGTITFMSHIVDSVYTNISKFDITLTLGKQL